jgi:hypothetical protein
MMLYIFYSQKSGTIGILSNSYAAMQTIIIYIVLTSSSAAPRFSWQTFSLELIFIHETTQRTQQSPPSAKLKDSFKRRAGRVE